LGQFNYGKQGLLDLDHKRRFTFGSIRRLLESSGYEILEIKGIPAPYPEAIGDNFFSRFLLMINHTRKISRQKLATLTTNPSQID
jgi:hypothetical protein